MVDGSRLGYINLPWGGGGSYFTVVETKRSVGHIPNLSNRFLYVYIQMQLQIYQQNLSIWV